MQISFFKTSMQIFNKNKFCVSIQEREIENYCCDKFLIDFFAIVPIHKRGFLIRHIPAQNLETAAQKKEAA